MLDPFAALESFEFDQEGGFDDLGPEFLQEQRGCFSGAAGGEEIVNQQHAAARLDGIDMDSDGVASIFQVVALLVRAVGELAFFADRDKPGAEAQSGGGCEDETTSVDSDHTVNFAGLMAIDQKVDACGKKSRVRENGRDVLELNSRLREVGNVANGVAKIRRRFGGHDSITSASLRFFRSFFEACSERCFESAVLFRA